MLINVKRRRHNPLQKPPPTTPIHLPNDTNIPLLPCYAHNHKHKYTLQPAPLHPCRDDRRIYHGPVLRADKPTELD